MSQLFSRRDTVLNAGALATLAFSQGAYAATHPVSQDSTLLGATQAEQSPKPPFDVFIKNPFASSFCISPDATKIAFVMQRGDDKILAHMGIDGTNKASMNIGPAKVENLFFIDNENLLLGNSLTVSLAEYAARKIEASLAHIINLKSHKMTTLYESMENFYPMIAGDLTIVKSKDGARIAASNILIDHINHVFYREIYSFSTNGSVSHQIFVAPDDTRNIVLKSDGTPAGYSEFDNVHTEWRLYANIAPTKPSPVWKLIYTEKSNKFKIDLMGLGRTDDTLTISLYDENGMGVICEIDATGKVSDPLFDGRSRTHYSPLFHPTTLCLAGFRLHKDWIENDYFDPQLKKISDALSTVFDENDHVYIHSFAEDIRKVIVYAESNTDAGSYYFIDFSTGKATFLAANYPGIPADWLSHKDIITYKAGDGLTISAYLSLPPHVEAKALPLIVMPHGGPRDRDYADFDGQVQCLTSAGYAVLQPNFRGSTGYGADFVTAGDGEWGRKMQTDLSDGVRYVASKGLVDAKRVSIMGASYGGYAALAGATLDHGVYNAAIATAAVSDIPAMMGFEKANSNWEDDPAVRYWRDLYGPQENWAAISPARQAANADCPVLIFHGRDDTVVPFEQGQSMASALKAAGKICEFVAYDKQDHNETNQANRIDMMQQTLAFLAKYNPV